MIKALLDTFNHDLLTAELILLHQALHSQPPGEEEEGVEEENE